MFPQKKHASPPSIVIFGRETAMDDSAYEDEKSAAPLTQVVVGRSLIRRFTNVIIARFYFGRATRQYS
jgi:hypothetical protein